MGSHFFYCSDEAVERGLELKKMTKAKKWEPFNAQSLFHQPIENSLIVQLHSTGRWAMVNEVWRSAFIPKHQCVLQRGTSRGTTIGFVLWSGDYGFQTWSVERAGTTTIKLQAHGARPELEHIFSFKDVQIVPLSPFSLVESYMQSDIQAEDYGALAAHGKPIDVLQYQALHGFRNVSEASMRALYADLKMEEPDIADTGLDLETNLAWGLMKHYLPALDEAGALDILSKRMSDEKEDEYSKDHLEVCVSNEILDDCTQRSDKKVVKDFLADTKASAQHAKTKLPILKTFLSTQFKKKGKAAKPSGPVALPYKFSKPAAAERWWASVTGDRDFIQANKPPVGGCFVDDKNGRYRISYPGHQPESVSWTKRSTTGCDASVVALHKLWTWHTAATGEPCP